MNHALLEMLVTEKLSLTFYEYENNVFTVEPAPMERAWMSDTHSQNSPRGHAYRCLPLMMANQSGWQVTLKQNVRAVWTGERDKETLMILNGSKGETVSIFGNGILTFLIPALIRTPPDYDLWITGAPNFFIRNAAPMTGLYEADWSPYTFTMNWKVHERGFVEFRKGDPICFFFPIKRRQVEEFEVKREMLTDHPELKAQVDDFHSKRKAFNAGLDRRDPEITKTGWQRHYFRGLYPDGGKCPIDHQTKLVVDGGSYSNPEKCPMNGDKEPKKVANGEVESTG